MGMLNYSLELRTHDEKVHLEELKLKNILETITTMYYK